MSRKIINGRPAVDRAGVAELTGAARGTVDKWYAQRGRFGFPERAERGYWYEGDVLEFWRRYQRVRLEALSRVDRSGHPDELVGTREAARILGRDSHHDLPKDLLANPDEAELLPSGRARRSWRRDTVWRYAEEHVGKQRVGRASGPARPRGIPYLEGNPEDLVNSTEAARVLGYSHRNNLPERVLLAADEVQYCGGSRATRRWKRRTLWQLLAEI